MAFEVADFETFFAILGQHPEWQVRLRRMLLDEATADSRRAMEEGFARLTATLESFASETRPQLGKLESDVAGLTASLESFASETRPRLDTLETDVGTLREDVSTLKVDVSTLKVDVGTLREDVSTLKVDVSTLKVDVSTVKVDVAALKGESKEHWYRERANAVFGRFLGKVQPVFPNEIPAVAAAIGTGLLTDAEWDDLSLLDLILRGRDTNGELIAALEVSAKLDADDISRVERRAALLRKAGLRVVAGIAGPPADERVDALAREHDVAVVRDGLVVHWPEPS